MKSQHVYLLFIAVVISAASFGQQKDSSGINNKPDSIIQFIYTCPMHPGIKSYSPGKCPDCGMELVEKKIKLKMRKYYTCGMHPAVTSDTSGRCPYCGMGLIEKVYVDSSQQKKKMQ